MRIDEIQALFKGIFRLFLNTKEQPLNKLIMLLTVSQYCNRWLLSMWNKYNSLTSYHCWILCFFFLFLGFQGTHTAPTFTAFLHISTHRFVFLRCSLHPFVVTGPGSDKHICHYMIRNCSMQLIVNCKWLTVQNMCLFQIMLIINVVTCTWNVG